MWKVKSSKKSDSRPRIAVHKFSSCDGCQLAFLNAGEDLLTLSQLVQIVHFAEAGMVAPEVDVDIAFIEGSISTPDEAKRIRAIREKSKYLITIGACATAGGIQALRNGADSDAWRAAIYPSPQFIESLATSTAIAQHVRVDLELWGCPVNSLQVLSATRDLLSGVVPAPVRDSVCIECKRQGNVCVMVARQEPCLGPVTQTGCGALCPSHGRGCYACYGPSENPNTTALANQLRMIGLSDQEIARRFLFINNQAPVFAAAAEQALTPSLLQGEGV
ncbi:MAG: sulfhydrogenase subunit delta [Gammaproteobacteria bacterium]|nr:sulfhydrogenase subunit delta [Gammaproteobacteria bacterium]